MQFPLKMDLDQDLRNCFLGIRKKPGPKPTITLLETNIAPENRPKPKRKKNLPSIFQVRKC